MSDIDETDEVLEENEDTTSDEGTEDAGADQLGDAGKQALDRMKAKVKQERDARKALEAKLAEAMKDQQGAKDGEPADPEKIRAAAKAELQAELLKERALDKVEAKAAKLFADPEDAVALLRGQVDDFIDDGKVDLEAITEALSDLLSKKPHLAAQGGRRFGGGADGGARKGSSKPDQLTENDLTKMTPAAIVKAQEDGRLNDLLGIS